MMEPIRITPVLGVTVQVGPAGLPEAYGGIGLRYGLMDGSMVVTFTREQAVRLGRSIAEELAATPAGGEPSIERRPAFYMPAVRRGCSRGTPFDAQT